MSSNIYTHIHDNAPGCNSAEEVLDSCNITTIEEKILNESFAISPNPVGSSAVINYKILQPSFVTLKIIDIRGREMAVLFEGWQQPGEQRVILDGSQLKPGVYFCTLKTNNGMQTRKIIKL
jgi:hypothetical protein